MTPESIAMFIPGKPATAGSKTPVPTKRGIRLVDGNTASAREHRKNWRQTIQGLVLQEMRGAPPWQDPIIAALVFYMPVPKSMPKRDRGVLAHIKRPDLTKLVRAAEDALTGILWTDDSQVYGCHHRKEYAWDGRIGMHLMAMRMDREALEEDAAKRDLRRSLGLHPSNTDPRDC